MLRGLHQTTIRIAGLFLMFFVIAGCAGQGTPTEPPTAESIAMADTATPEPSPATPTSTPSPMPTRTRTADDGAFPVASYTPTPTATATATNTPPYTATPTPTSTPTITPTPRYIPRNADWTPVERSFDGITMVQVPPGCFDMGEDGEGGRQCFDEPFWIGKYEVTNAEYAEFIVAGGYDNLGYWTTVGWRQRHSRNWTQPISWSDTRFNSDQQPVVGVSWHEAAAYTSWRGLSLCTEAQWEYAARGPDNLVYPWGNEFVPDNVVYGGSELLFVGSRSGGASWVGAVDMSGNVAEWTLSVWTSYPYDGSDGRETVEGMSRRVVRGGSRGSSNTGTNTTRRLASSPLDRLVSYGIRVCAPASLDDNNAAD